MPKEITWSDPDDIGILLSEIHPQLDPLAVRFTDLHKYVIALPGFKDDPTKSNEARLEAIQMAWHSRFSTEPRGRLDSPWCRCDLYQGVPLGLS